MLTLIQILPHFKGRKIKVAKALGISKQAVSKWPDGVLPKERERQIREDILPDCFGPTSNKRTKTLAN